MLDRQTHQQPVATQLTPKQYHAAMLRWRAAEASTTGATGALPVYDHRLIIGYAKSAQAAQRLARQAHQGIPSGFQVVARRRDTSIIDLPEGWIYSIVKHY